MAIHSHLLLLFYALLALLKSQTTFEAFKADMESKVKSIADQMSAIYDRRCEAQILQCQTKSFSVCEGSDSKICYDNFPKSDECLSEGAYLSQTSTVSYPKDQSSLTAQEELFICASALLQDKFKEVGSERNGKFTFSYIGTNLGSVRFYPGKKDTQICETYDPRFRPWYVTAASGSKNVILLLDISGSMESDFRLDSAKEALISVVSTLSNNDFVGVVTFSDEANSRSLSRATIQNKESIIEYISGLSPDGSTNYKAAFDKAFQILQNAKKDEFGSPCSNAQNIFLFLTDGKPTVPEGYTKSNELIDHINSIQNGYTITLFTYGFGPEVDSNILLDLSCEFRGINTNIPNVGSTSELVTTMRNYYTYVSEGIHLQTPIWAEPYEDAFGFGTIVTVAMPIYYYDSTGIRIILGVAGLDVTLKTFEEYGLTDQDEIVRKLISNLPCPSSSLDRCDIQALRDDDQKCPDHDDCSVSNQSLNCLEVETNSIFIQAQVSDESICCGITVGALIGIIVGVVVLAIILGIAVFCVLKRRGGGGGNNNNNNNNVDSAQNFKYNQSPNQPRMQPQEHPGFPVPINNQINRPNPYMNNNLGPQTKGNPYGIADSYQR